MSLGRRLVAELVGTFALVFVGSLSVDTSGSLVAVALAHGLVLAVMVYAIGSISGCHINPAISLAMLAVRRLNGLEAAGYVLAQLLGASIAGILHALVTPWSRTYYGLTLPTAQINGSSGVAFALEAVSTFFLALIVYQAAIAGKVPEPAAGLAIGLTLAAAILAVGPMTGAALNPARAFGPALASGNFSSHWAYWLGPIVGAFAAFDLGAYLSRTSAS
jgi:MIP family channel proteins